MKDLSRGFTVLELVITAMSIGLTASAIGHAYLNGRVSAARLEADLVMERSASLAAAWVARLGRSAANITPAGKGVLLELHDGQRVNLVAEDRRLVEERAGVRTVIARHIDGIRVEEQTRSWVLEIHAVRPLVDGAEHRRARSIRIPRSWP